MLNINKNLNGETLTVSLEGRLDTTTAPQLEESLKESMVGIKELILDFADVIMEIFEVTGFVDILTIE